MSSIASVCVPAAIIQLTSVSKQVNIVYKHAQRSAEAEWGARREGLSGLEGLLAIVGHKVTMKGTIPSDTTVKTSASSERWRERVTETAIAE